MHSFMITLLLCSVAMSALVLFYMAITPLLAKRYSVTGRYYTWLVIIIGLIIPFRPQFNHAIIKVDMPGHTAVPADVTASVGNALPSALTNVSWQQITAAVWLAGMLLFLAYHVIRHYRFLKLTARWSENITDKQTLTLLQNLKTQMGISQNISLQICESIGSPMMIGFVKHRILLPRAGFGEEELRFILKHELVHYKRKDLWYKGLVLAAAAIHWFNPIVHLMAKAIEIQCELSCDAEVVRGTDADIRQYYSEAILGAARYQSKLKTALSTNFYGGKKGMKTRIFSIMDMNRKKAGLSILCGALLLTLGTGFALAANAETQNPPEVAIAEIQNPDIYTQNPAFGGAVSEDGTELFITDAAQLFINDAKTTLSVTRDASGQITGIERSSDGKAQK